MPRRALPALRAARATFASETAAPDRQPAPGAGFPTARALRRFLEDRSQPACDARAAAAHYLYNDSGWSLSQIGGAFQRHHSTILHSRDRIADLLDVDRGFAQQYRKFLNLLT